MGRDEVRRPVLNRPGCSYLLHPFLALMELLTKNILSVFLSDQNVRAHITPNCILAARIVCCRSEISKCKSENTGINLSRLLLAAECF